MAGVRNLKRKESKMAGGTKQDYINTMQSAANEIRLLRQANEMQQAQLYIVGIFAAALGFKPQPQGMGEDVAWKLEKHIEAIKKDIEYEKADAAAKVNRPLVSDDI